MKVKAKLKYLRMSPRKVRLVADVIRGLDVKEAEEQLRFVGKRSAAPIHKLLLSAVASAENQGLEASNLYINSFVVDGGPTLKRYRPRMGGRANEIRKRTSHIVLTLEERTPTKKKRKAAAKKLQKPNAVVKEDTKEQDTSEKPERHFRAPKEEGISPKVPGFVKRVFRRKSI